MKSTPLPLSNLTWKLRAWLRKSMNDILRIDNTHVTPEDEKHNFLITLETRN